ETPWNLIHARNVVTLIEAGATVLPAIPSFYNRRASLTAVVDTVVGAFLTKLGYPVLVHIVGARRASRQKPRARKAENRRMACAMVDRVWISLSATLGAHAAF